MNINYKESQIDFLSHVNSTAEAPVPPRYMAAQISLSLENLVILAIVAIMVVIFSFSLGIDRGKKIALTVPASSDVAQPLVQSSVRSTEKDEKTADKNAAKDLKSDALKAKPVMVSSQTLAKAGGAGDARTVAAKPATSGAFTVQVASYKAAKPAQREADKLKLKGFKNVYVLPSGTHMIVCVGNFQSKEDASGLKRQLKKSYQDNIVRRL